MPLRPILTLLLCLLVLARLQGQVIDKTFHSALSEDDLVNTMVRQPDGKILVGGQFSINNNTYAVLRLNADGSIDPAFTKGSIDGTYHYLLNISLQADGRILVGGTFETYAGQPAHHLVRLNPDGTTDGSFKGTIGITDPASQVREMLVMPNGQILVGGSFRLHEDRTYRVLARLNADGSLDDSFQTSNGLQGFTETIALQQEGRILLGGNLKKSNNEQDYIYRLEPDGSIDPSFPLMKTARGFYSINKINVLPNKQILLAGDWENTGPSDNIGIMRLNADGTKDNNFQTEPFRATYGGLLSSPLYVVADLLVQPDGRLLLSGRFTRYGATDANGIIRLNADGSLQTAFNACAADYSTNRALIQIALLPDGRILAAGQFQDFQKSGNHKLVRLNANPPAQVPVKAGFDLFIKDNTVSFRNTSTGALHYSWQIGNGPATAVTHPSVTFSNAGNYSVTLTAYGPCGTSSTLTKNFSIVRLSGIFPATGGDGGTATVRIKGFGFTDKSLIRLNGPAGQLSPISTFIDEDGFLQATFNLKDKVTGAYDVTVSTNGSSATLKSGYQIQKNLSLPMSVELLGPPAIRPGVKQTYTVKVHNPGNNDAYLVPVSVTVPENVELTPNIDFQKIESITGVAKFKEDTVSLIQKADGKKALPVLVPIVPAGADYTFDVTLTGGTNGTQMDVKANVFQPLVNPAGILNGKNEVPFTDCTYALISGALEIAGNVIGKNCALNIAFAATSYTWNIYAFVSNESKKLATETNGYKKAFSLVAFTAGLEPNSNMKDIIEHCIEDEILKDAWKFVFRRTFLLAMTGISVAKTVYDLYQDCGSYISSKLSIVFSKDPNEKQGPLGGGALHYVQGNNPFDYRVNFENMPDATAAAQEVRIEDNLDPTKFDLSSFRFTGYGFGKDVLQTIGPGYQEYTATRQITGQHGSPLLVRLDAKLDIPAHLVTWRFSSIDPATLENTTDALEGFLPPNTDGTQGQGYVSFCVQPLASLTTSEQVQNRATIWFDQNAAIQTNLYNNGIDKTKPASKMKALEPVTTSKDIILNWTGTDTGSGVASYDIYAATNDQEFRMLAQNIQTNTLAFKGEADSTYRFFVLARDLAGNTENGKQSAETQTRISVKKAQTISFKPLTNVKFGDPDILPEAASDTGLPITLSCDAPAVATIRDGKIHLTGAGKATITATQAGNEQYGAATPVQILLEVFKGTQTITFAELLDRRLATANIDPGAIASSALPITYTSSNPAVATIIAGKIHPLAAGQTTITATQEGNGNYVPAAPVARLLQVLFSLPNDHFKISTTGETCREANNGQVTIEPGAVMDYHYTLTTGTQTLNGDFKNKTTIGNLPAGNYELCLTLPANSAYRQCYQIAISEPKDLSVFASTDRATGVLTLNLKGGNHYTVYLNGQEYRTTASLYTLQLASGQNTLRVLADNECQGVYEAAYSYTGHLTAYPNPAEHQLFLKTATAEASGAPYVIRDIMGIAVQQGQLDIRNHSGTLEIGRLKAGVYILKITLEHEEQLVKIIKK